MSKPDATSAKSLEEIIASIRKSLSGQAGGSADTRGDASRRQRIEPELPPAAAMPDRADGLLTDRLAGALNGAPNGAAFDDDLSDILAQDAKQPAAPRPAVAVPRDADGDRRGLPWLAGRTPEAKEPPAAPPAVAVELSRPEDLRTSLPPLFEEGAEHPPQPAARIATEASKVAGVGLPKAWPPPPPAPHTVDGIGAAAGSSIWTARTRPPMLAPEAPPASVARSGETGGEEAQAATPTAPPAFETPPPAAPVGAEAAVDESARKPAAADGKPAADPLAGAAGEVGPHEGMLGAALTNGEAEAAKPAPTAALSARTLEQVIAELLEPVIRNWLESNLPRMVEKVVREEVVRAIAAERAAPKA